MDDIDNETLRKYRQIFEIRNDGHVWNALDDKSFLEKLGGYRKDRKTGVEGLTLAGLLAITLWKAKGNLFYLLNFSYIGGCLALGTALFTAGKRYTRHFLGVFEAATIHCAVAKIFGPLFFNPACSLR